MKKMAICFTLKTIMLRAISILVVSSAMAVACNWTPMASFCLASGGGIVSQERMTTETHQYSLNRSTADENPIGYKRVKKATFCQNGKILHLKTNSDESKNHLSKRVLRKKLVIRRNVKLDEEREEVIEDDNLEDGKGIIQAIYTLLEKKEGPVVEEELPKSGEDTICGLSNNGFPYVILKSGDKIFKGGKLGNGCIVDTIADDHVILICNGLKRKQTL